MTGQGRTGRWAQAFSFRLGVRLALAGGRESLLRLAFTAVGVAVGVTLLLLALTGASAMRGRAERTAWLDAAYAVTSAERPAPPAESADGALFLAVTDYYDGIRMTRAYVAPLGADPPVPPGLDRLPGPGEVAASPAMRRLLESTPDDQLDARFPGRVTMTIQAAGLAQENQLVALIGRTPDELRGVRSVQEVRAFHGVVPGDFAIASVLQLFVLAGAVLVLVPVLILIVTVTRVAAAHREQRLAAIRLVGATRLQIAVLASVETGIAALAGSALAWAGYEAGRRVLAATVTFQRGRFYLEDLAVPPVVLALVLLGAPVLVLLTTIAALRRVQFSPLVVGRRGPHPAPTAWRLLPIGVGVGGLLVVTPLPDIGHVQVGQLTVPFAFLALGGLLFAGPWLCLLASQAIARLSRSVPALIAARRIAIDPRATFLVVSGVVLAASAVTYIGSTTDQFRPPDGPGVVRLRPGVVQVATGGVSAEQVAPLLSGQAVTTSLGGDGLLAPCAELSRVRDVSCPYAVDSGLIEPATGARAVTVLEVYIPTDGTLAAENRVRTQAANLVPNAIINTDRDPVDYQLETFFVDLGRLGRIAALFVLLVAACGLTAGMIGSLVQRRRPFALLHASGMRIGELRQAVFLETAATMVITSALGVALGLIFAYAAARQGGVAFRWPGLDVFALVGSGVLATLIFSTFALPLVKAATKHDAIRYE